MDHYLVDIYCSQKLLKGPEFEIFILNQQIAPQYLPSYMWKISNRLVSENIEKVKKQSGSEDT